MLFRLSEVHKSYGVQDVLRGASLQVNAGEHAGLVGRNGAGKHTIFRLVRGEESADRGDVVRARNVKLGLLDQHVHFEPGSTVHESALAAFGRLQQIEHEMHELEHRMADAATTSKKFSSATAICNTSLNTKVVLNMPPAEAILQGLGFERDMWSLETEKASGGQQNRLGLACLLLAAPDVLLLDEPTNHLDVNAVEWLEEFLQGTRRLTSLSATIVIFSIAVAAASSDSRTDAPQITPATIPIISSSVKSVAKLSSALTTTSSI